MSIATTDRGPCTCIPGTEFQVGVVDPFCHYEDDLHVRMLPHNENGIADD